MIKPIDSAIWLLLAALVSCREPPAEDPPGSVAASTTVPDRAQLANAILDEFVRESRTILRSPEEAAVQDDRLEACHQRILALGSDGYRELVTRIERERRDVRPSLLGLLIGFDAEAVARGSETLTAADLDDVGLSNLLVAARGCRSSALIPFIEEASKRKEKSVRIDAVLAATTIESGDAWGILDYMAQSDPDDGVRGFATQAIRIRAADGLDRDR